jgi:L-ribulokinase
MSATYLIGLDYGTGSARGVLIDTATGQQISSYTHAYRHGVMTRSLPDGTRLPQAWALQNAPDYTEAAEEILGQLGRGRIVDAIGIGFSASSPMPATDDGTPLSALHPGAPHAYVKLWKHRAAQPYADAINRRGGAFLDNFGGKLSSEWLLAKAAQIANEAPDIWNQAARFIEAGDWLVWQLTDNETRSLSFAAYKAQYGENQGYPQGIVRGLETRLAPPHCVGSAAGDLCARWRDRTGIQGRAIVAVAAIDSHVVLPAVGGVSAGCLVGALGTSAVYLYLSQQFQPLPPGIEGVAKDGSVRGLWCYEAGQAGFGDMLAWFVNAFPRGVDEAESFRIYNQEASLLEPGANHLVALDWWNGNRVPLADSSLSGLLVGLTTQTTSGGIYRALLESLCFGARSVVDLFEAGSLDVGQVILTSGLARKNPLLVQLMADVLERSIAVPDIAHATAVGAAIHGVVASGLVADFSEGAARYGARRFTNYDPDAGRTSTYRMLYDTYRALSGNHELQMAMRNLDGTASLSKISMN